MIEPAAGADRATLAFLVDAYDEEEVEGRRRTVLRLHPRLAPVKAAVLPLVPKEGMPERAREVVRAACAAACRPSTTRAARSASATAARTRSAPPRGSPWTTRRMEDDTVTLRDRDSLEQVRMPIDGLAGELAGRLAADWRDPEARLSGTSDHRSSSGGARVPIHGGWKRESRPRAHTATREGSAAHGV